MHRDRLVARFAALGATETVETSGPKAGVTRPSRLAELTAQVRNEPLLAGFVIAAIAVRVLFWVYTERVWEDAYITATHARNVFEGIGLTHHATEPRVHGFTSALSVLIPLVGETLGRGILSLRIASLVAAVFTLVFAYRSARLLGVGTGPLVFLLAFLAFDQQQVFFGMAGMETQVATAILLAGFYYVLTDRPTHVGVLLGAGILARPDLVLWAAAALAALIFRRHRPFPWWKPVAATAVVLAPWLVFTTLYYGTPVPHTVIAKNLYPNVGLGDLPTLGEIVDYSAHWWRSFAPFYENTFVTATPVPKFLLQQLATLFIVLAIGGVWVHRRNRAVLAAAAFVLAFVLYRTVARLPIYFAWYLPPFTALCALFASLALSHLTRHWRKLSTAMSLSLAAAYAVHIPFTYPLERRVQRDIEVAVRARVGHFLHDNMKPGQSVVFEPVGYFGWFGGPDKTYLDFPGLTSKRAEKVLAAAEPGDRTLALLVEKLDPEWMVLRPGELGFFQDSHPALLKRYEQAADFSAPATLDLTRGGVSYLSIDTRFLVLRKVGAPWEPG